MRQREIDRRKSRRVVRDRHDAIDSERRDDCFHVAELFLETVGRARGFVRRTEPISAETDLVEPLRYQNIKVIPNLSGEIAPQTKDISFFFMVHPDTHAAEYARLEMEILRNGESIGNGSFA